MKNLFRFNGTDRERAKGPKKSKRDPAPVAETDIETPEEKAARISRNRSAAGRKPRVKLYTKRNDGAKVSEEDADSFVGAKLKKEQALAEKGEYDAELRRMEIARQRKELVPIDIVRLQLEKEHKVWLDALEKWRQAIAKRISRCAIPVEVQESINDMISTEITKLRSERAGQQKADNAAKLEQQQ